MSQTPPSSSRREQLIGQGCWAENWDLVQLHPECDCSRIRKVHFFGQVRIGKNDGEHEIDGLRQPSGIFNASIANCEIEDNVRIANIGTTISNYRIDEGAVIENVASMVAGRNASFGNDVEVDVVNEGGGRGTKIINDLTAQTAYAQAMLRHNPAFTQKLVGLVEAKVNEAKSDKGRVGRHAQIHHCGPIVNVSFGPYAKVQGVSRLENGTVNSCQEHPTVVGAGVDARSFIFSEGASVDGGAILDKVFVGQGAMIGKQFSAENSLFFANCEGFHGEAVSVFAGPYTVTHHKSTLLIAGLFSFYNAGSGTNQSNHMYKLGPVHQGVLERGCKTGSFSYVLMESHIGAFSVVIGKHLTNVNIPNLPFSYIFGEDSESKIIPGMNLFSIGTVRDGEKWPQRDRRKVTHKRDLIVFDVFSPYTVEKMRRGRDELLFLSETVPRDKAFVNYGGLHLSRLLLKKGAKYYSLAISRYLNGRVCERLAGALVEKKSWSEAVASLKPAGRLEKADEWTDVSGLLTPRERMAALEAKVSDGSIAKYDSLLEEFREMYRRYHEDEWQYICEAFEKDYQIAIEGMKSAEAVQVLEEWKQSATSLHAMILEDAKKEFSHLSQIGYGVDQDEEKARLDFEAVRGKLETNSVIQKLVAEGNAIEERYRQFRDLFESFK